LLQVKDAEFEFDIRVLTRVPLQTPEDEKKDVQSGHAPSMDFLAPDRVELKGMLAPKQAGDAKSTQMGIKVKVRMEQADLPAGLIKLMHLMDHAVTAVPAKGPVTNGDQLEPDQKP